STSPPTRWARAARRTARSVCGGWSARAPSCRARRWRSTSCSAAATAPPSSACFPTSGTAASDAPSALFRLAPPLEHEGLEHGHGQDRDVVVLVERREAAG